MKLCNYKGLAIGKPEVTPVTEEEVMKEIGNLLASKGSFTTKEGKSALGDVVNIDYKGLLENVPFEGGTAEKYDLELGSGSFIPGFEDQLVGYSAGEDVDVNVTFPEQYHAENLAGKAVVFKCHIHEVKVKAEPVFDDAFAQGFGIPTAEKLKEEMTRQMNAKKKNDSDNEYINRVLKHIIDNSEIAVTDEAVTERIDEMMDYYESQIAQYGLDINTYLQMQGMTVEQFRDQLASQALDSAKDDVIFAEIIAKENITATDAEVDNELQQYKAYYNLDDAKFAEFKEERYEEVRDSILKRKVALILVQENN